VTAQATPDPLIHPITLEEAFSATTRDARRARALPAGRDQPRRVLPPLLGST
jgi:hypothetical protein